MTSQRVPDSKREEFRKYLEKAGVLDALTKVLVGLYEEPEKPANPLEFLQRHIHGGAPETADVEALKQEVKELKDKNVELQEEVKKLTDKIIELEEGGAQTEQS
ncbi:c-Myc-binding protein-like [Oscarella lobularis]|uniref:c-Myc-binding protein-like n=1 Tax=Oscarella lobularis TaxID=121494 RepID=UPI00331433EE